MARVGAVPSVTCHDCGATEAREIAVERFGVRAVLGHLCDGCFAVAQARADELRQQFDALLAAGLSREAANERMIAIVEGRGASA